MTKLKRIILIVALISESFFVSANLYSSNLLSQNSLAPKFAGSSIILEDLILKWQKKWKVIGKFNIDEYNNSISINLGKKQIAYIDYSLTDDKTKIIIHRIETIFLYRKKGLMKLLVMYALNKHQIETIEGETTKKGYQFTMKFKKAGYIKVTNETTPVSLFGGLIFEYDFEAKLKHNEVKKYIETYPDIDKKMTISLSSFIFTYNPITLYHGLKSFFTSA